MKELSFVEEFTLFSIDNLESGKEIYFKDKEVSEIVMAIFLELFINGFIEEDNDRNIVISSLNKPEKQYLKLTYNKIEKSKPKNLDKWVEDDIIKYPAMRNNEIVRSIFKHLIAENYVYIQKIQLIHCRELKHYKVNKQFIDNIIQKIRWGVLENGCIDEDTIALISLIELSRDIKHYFSEYESIALENKMKELQDNIVWIRGHRIEEVKKNIGVSGNIFIN